MRKVMATKAPEFSAYGHETVYWGQHSRRRTLKAYMKGRELEKHPMPDEVFRRAKLTRIAKRLVRLEFSLRAEELKRLNLRDVNNWSAEVAQAILKGMIKRVVDLKGKVPDLTAMSGLSRLYQDRLELLLRKRAAKAL
jgi:II/X family phage/plasmid replication protein